MSNEKVTSKKNDKDMTQHMAMLAKRWKNGCIGTSILSVVLLVMVLFLATQPPKTEYVYRSYPSSSSSGSSSSANSSAASSNDSNSSSSSSSALASKPETITYAAGEKVATSAKGVTIEIEQVIKNYQNYPSSWGPESGYEYVQVKLKFKNASSNAIHLYSSDFNLKDSEGMMDDAQSAYHDNSSSYFPFSKEIAGGGTEVSGVMVFEVRKGATDNLTFLYEKNTAAKRISIDL